MIPRKTYIPFGETNDKTIDYLLGIIEDARATTLQRIENISTEELHWQYAEGWNSISALLSHFISTALYFRIEFIEGRHLDDEERKEIMPGLEMGKYIKDLINDEPVEYYLKELERATGLLTDSIKQLNFDDFSKKREGYNPDTGNNLAWVLYHTAEDEVHHRGQISIIRKLYKMRKI